MTYSKFELKVKSPKPSDVDGVGAVAVVSTRTPAAEVLEIEVEVQNVGSVTSALSATLYLSPPSDAQDTSLVKKVVAFSRVKPLTVSGRDTLVFAFNPGAITLIYLLFSH